MVKPEKLFCLWIFLFRDSVVSAGLGFIWLLPNVETLDHFRKSLRALGEGILAAKRIGFGMGA